MPKSGNGALGLNPNREAVTARFLLDSFQDGTKTVDGLRRRLASFARQRKTMDLAIDQWDDESGAIAPASPKLHLKTAVLRPPQDEANQQRANETGGTGCAQVTSMNETASFSRTNIDILS